MLFLRSGGIAVRSGRKLISMLLVVSVVLSAGLINCAFAANNNANQQNITVTAEKIKKDGAYVAIQNALEIARKNATDKKRYTVEVESGDYELTDTLKIFSNTQLKLKKVTLTRSEDSDSNMIRIGNSDSADC